MDAQPPAGDTNSGGRTVTVPLPSARSPTAAATLAAAGGGSSFDLGVQLLQRERTVVGAGVGTELRAAGVSGAAADGDVLEYEYDEDAMASPLLVSHLNSASLAAASRWTSGAGRSHTFAQVCGDSAPLNLSFGRRWRLDKRSARSIVFWKSAIKMRAVRATCSVYALIELTLVVVSSSTVLVHEV